MIKIRTFTLSTIALAAALVLGGCGARSGDDTVTDGAGAAPGFNGDGSAVGGEPGLGAAVAPNVNFELFSDNTDIETGGSAAAVITATLIDDSRVPVAGATVAWEASGGVLQDVVAETDANGVATALLRMPQDFRNRDIDVDVSSGDYSSRITIRAYGTKLDLQGDEKTVVQFSDLELAVVLTAGNDEPIVNKPITVTTQNGNTVSPASPVTDRNGRATFSIGSAIGGDVVSVAALDDPSLTRSFEFAVSSDQLGFSTEGDRTEFTVNTLNFVDVAWSSGGQAVIDGPLRVTTTAGQILSASVLNTDATGAIRIPVSSGSAGDAQITVEDAVDGDPSATFDVEFVATVPSLIDLATTSSRVYVDDVSNITALVRDINGNPVKNQEVVFTSDDLYGGQLSPSSAITDAEGKARTGFSAGSNATEIDAIEIVGTVQGATGASGAPLSSATRLSVVERRLNVTIGAAAVLETIGLETQNARNMVVQVADGSGAPIAGAEVTVSITPLEYSKGQLAIVDSRGRTSGEAFAVGDDWTPAAWSYRDLSDYVIDCAAEDVNLNRILDIEQAEDRNGNGMLDPQDPAVLTAVADASAFATLDGNGRLTTDANGTGYFRVVYPKGNANWSTLRITARANALGTEAQDSIVDRMLSLVDDLDDHRIVPPNRLSPYGTQLDCSTAD